MKPADYLLLSLLAGTGLGMPQQQGDNICLKQQLQVTQVETTEKVPISFIKMEFCMDNLNFKCPRNHVRFETRPKKENVTKIVFRSVQRQESIDCCLLLTVGWNGPSR